MELVSLATILGPLVIGFGYLSGSPVFFWFGVLVCLARLVRVAFGLGPGSGVRMETIRHLGFSLLFMLGGAVVMNSSYEGIGLGLAIWTEAAIIAGVMKTEESRKEGASVPATPDEMESAVESTLQNQLDVEVKT